MSGYYELRGMGVQFGPFDSSPPSGAHRWDRFDTNWGETCALLARELANLDAKRIVCELDLSESDFRNDGLPRANARAFSPAVRVTFESKWGPLRYETAEFASWQANVRAIALSMEALRKVDRYGVSKRGEQYRGWKALPASTDAADAISTREQAEALLESYGGLTAALKATHPDMQGGDTTAFRKVMRAKELTA